MQIEHHKYNLNIDSEFESLHIMASEESMNRLEKSIIANGIAHPLVTWRGSLVDGHKRYKICSDMNISFSVYEKYFESRYDVMEWICDQCLLRADLTEEYRKYYIGKKFLIRHSKPHHYIDDKTGVKISHNRYDTAKRIGIILNVSYGTVLKYSRYAAAIDKIRIQEPQIVQRILSGAVKVSQENIAEISQLSADDLRILKHCFTEKNRDHLSQSEIWHELQWNRVHPTMPTSRKKKAQYDAQIKQMPEYDPDAELSSLSFTIPSWVRTIERTANNANFLASSESAKDKLRCQLRELAKAADYLYYQIREASNE